MEKFMINLGRSLLAWIVASLSGFLMVGISFATGDFPTTEVYYFPSMAEIITWIHSLVVIAAFFFVGTELHLLKNQWWNLLSVCGIAVIGLLLALTEQYFTILVVLVFIGLINVTRFIEFGNPHVEYTVLTTIPAILPSLIIWLGMLYKSKKVEKSAKVTD